MTTIAAHVRWMIRADLPHVLAIERANMADPWPEAAFLNTLQSRNVRGRIIEVDEHPDQPVGFMIHHPLDDRVVIHNMGIHPICQRHGLGSILLGNLLSKLKVSLPVVANVSADSFAAQKFFQHFGFRAVEILHNPNPEGEDLYRMELRRV